MSPSAVKASPLEARVLPGKAVMMIRYPILFFLCLMLSSHGAVLAYELDGNNDGYIDDGLLPPSLSRDSERLALPRARGKSWNILEEYDKGDMAIDPATLSIYVSKVNANVGNVLTNAESWEEKVSDGGASSFAELSGNPTDNIALGTAFDGKQNRISTQCFGTQKMIGALLDGTPICADDQIGATGTGDITDVIAGIRIDGGGTSGSVTVDLDADTVAEIVANTAKRTYPTADETKLASIAPSATANSTDADLRDRSTHTGTQSYTTITGLGTVAVLNVGTSPGNIPQLGGACTVGDGAYTDQATCETNAGQWIGVMAIICDPTDESNNGCNAIYDLLSASEINTRISNSTPNLSAPGPIGNTTPNTGVFTDLQADSFDFGAPSTGETGEIGFQEDQANGTNVVTLKAAGSIPADVVFILPTADGAAGSAVTTDGSGNLIFAPNLLTEAEVDGYVDNNGYLTLYTEVDPTVDTSGEIVGIINTAPSLLISETAIDPGVARDSEVTLAAVTAPTAATDPCTAGTWAHDASFFYICTASGAWLKAAIATW